MQTLTENENKKSRWDDLYEIKYFRPEDPESLFKRERFNSHYVYVNCWREERNGIYFYKIIGAEGWFPFPDGFCPEFLGYFPAVVLGQISSDRKNEEDRWVEYKGI